MSVTIASPLAGWATPLSDVPDPVFAEKMLGDGIAIDPVDGRLAAPGAGVVVSVHPAGHAVTLRLDAGPMLLMHIGLDTVGLGGEGFAPKVADGQRVAAGQLLVEFDLDRLARTAKSLITPIIVTNGEAFALETSMTDRAVSVGDPVMSWRALAVSDADTVSEAPVASRTLDLPLAHGLHARPAARIAKLAADYTGTLEILAPSGKVASARSAVAMLALALPYGAAITVRGSDADGVTAIVDLLATGMGEFRAVSPGSPSDEPTELPSILPGVIAVPGTAIGPAFRIIDPAADIAEAGQGVAAERAALDRAKSVVRSQIEADAVGTSDRAGIASAHLMLLDDPELASAADIMIVADKSAGFAWREAIAGFVAQLRDGGDARFVERIDDLEDIGRRVVATIQGNPEQEPPSPGAILIADDLYPSQLMALADAGLVGIATARGGTTSHVAIIAAGMGVPMLISLGAALNRIDADTDLVIADGSLSIAPDAVAVTALRERIATQRARRQAALATALDPAVTIDGVRIEVFVNLGSAVDAQRAVAEGAEGCGLLRTEFLFLDRATPPDEDEQRDAYQAIADALGDRPLIVRTLDIGADKPAPYVAIAAEENPALGLRGIRLQLARRDLLDSQLRALLRVKSATPLRIMLPMVADRAELVEARAALARHAADLGVPAPELGIMVETPAAALIASTLAIDADFFSIGSNDLTQYTLARDRTNPAVAAGLDGLHPAVLRLIDETVRGGVAHRRWTGVCGGLAADPQAVPLLIGLGVIELSVPGAAVAETKALVRTLDLARCRAIAARALVAADAAAVRALVRSLSEQAQ